MKELVNSFKNQLIESYEIAKTIEVSTNNNIENVVITGLGGSGIGGKIVSDLVYNAIDLPITLNRGYELPNFVSDKTLVIVSSYSGNTEETVICLEKAMEVNAKIFCISSGGKVIDIAKESKLDYVTVPGGNSPRAMLSYSITQLIFALQAYGLLQVDLNYLWSNCIDFIDNNTIAIQEEAREIAEFFKGKIPVLYGVDGFAGVTERFRQQINENAKMLCWHHIIPEMNHNELVGWTEKHEDIAVLFMQNTLDYQRNATRFKLNQDIISKYAEIKVLTSKGSNHFENTMYWIHLGDWVSVYLSEINDVDPVEVRVIDFLKKELGKS